MQRLEIFVQSLGTCADKTAKDTAFRQTAGTSGKA